MHRPRRQLTYVVILIILWAGQFQAHAQCGGIYNFTENFDTGQIPSCWTAFNGAGMEGTRLRLDNPGNFPAMIVFQPMLNAKGVLTFDGAYNPSFGPAPIEIGAMSHPNNHASFVPITGFAINQNRQYVVDLSTYSGNNLYIAIRTPSNPHRRAYLDNIHYRSQCTSNSVTAVAQDITVQLDAQGTAVVAASDVDNGSMSSCQDPATVSLDLSQFTCDDIGSNTVTLTAQDDMGNTDETTATVTIVPAVIAQDLTVELDENGNASIAPEDIDNGSSDICGESLTLSLDHSSFTCLELGENVVTLSALDNLGNISTAESTVTIVDNSPPTVLVQDLEIQLDANSGRATIAAAMIDNGSSDNCSTNLTMTLSQTEFTCDNIGTNSVTLTVDDENGNSASNEAIVTITSIISDQTVSAVSTDFCPDNATGTTISIDGSTNGVNYYLRNSADNSIVDGPVSGTGSEISFSTGSISETTTFNVYGETNVTGGNNQAMTLAGTSGFISVPNSSSLQLNSNWTLEAWVKPATGGVLNVIETYDTNGGFILRTSTTGRWQAFAMFSGASYHALNSNSPVTVGQWTHVAATFDETANELKIYVNGVLDATLANATIDQRASLTNIKIGARGDDSKKHAQHSQDEIRIWNVTRTPEEIQAKMSACLTGGEPGLVAYYNFNDQTFASSGMVIEDKSTNGNNGSIVGHYTAANFIPGTITCTTNCGYQMSEEITVGDIVPPDAIAQNITVELNEEGNYTLTASSLNDNSSDNCTAASELVFEVDQTEFDCTNLGDNVVELTVIDASGNQNAASAIITIEDNIAPTVRTQNVSLELDENGNASLETDLVNNGTSDNCTVSEQILLSLDRTEFSCTEIGDQTVTLTATDNAGNESSATASVTVVDLVAPVAISQDITIELDATGNATISADMIDNGSNDNCTAQSQLSLQLDIIDFSCADLGENVVSLSVTDASQNTSFIQANVLVQDNIAPQAIGQDITIRLDEQNNAGISASDLDNGSTDNCSDITLSVDISTFDETNIGSNTVSLTAVDGSGNSNTTIVTVTVDPYKQQQSITFDELGNKTYGDTDFDLSAVSSAELDVTYEVLSGPITVSGSLVSITGSGEATISASQPGNEDYFAADPVQISFLIQKADLSVTADDQSMKYGSNIPELTYAYSGFVNGEGASHLISEPTISTSASNTSDVGSYTIDVAGGSAENYELSYTNGTLTISQAEAEIIITNLEQTVDESPKSPTITTNPAGLNYILTFNESQDLPSAPGEYEVSVTIDELNFFGTKTATFILNEVLSIGDINENLIKIYPNPASDLLTLSILDIPATQVKIFNIHGSVVADRQLASNVEKIDVSFLTTGIYVLTILDDQNTIIKKERLLIR